MNSHTLMGIFIAITVLFVAALFMERDLRDRWDRAQHRKRRRRRAREAEEG